MKANNKVVKSSHRYISMQDKTKKAPLKEKPNMLR